ncbi:TolC family outer membrane protein [Devosia sp. RR2S18]|uniref:TolC family outer membrane protein n=1 Tax=Devosia rhizosphaerae TaxID=3049774 RepID=UPI002540172D|nr:TolC family outer membrane protein [Devosia sp. RR2S18]WIJ23900.1 TolC family outer membrane protein [Devosia sp. RR2S18]
MTQALTAACSFSPELQSAVLQAKASAENIAQALSQKRPTIGASLSGNYNWSMVGGQFNDSQSLTTGLQYNQTIFDNFQTDARVEAARAGAEIARHQIFNTAQNVLLSVVQAYMSVLSDRQLVALRQENLEFQAQLQSAQDRLEVGEGTRIDVAQAEARLAQGRAAYQAAISSLEVSEATFQRYVGASPGSLGASHNYARLIPSSIQAAIAQAEANHPAILISKAAIRAAQAGSDAAQAAFGPTASLTGQVGTRWTGPSGAPTDGMSGSVGISITIPIYAGGAIGSGVRQANLEQIQSEVDAMSAYDQIREAVISAWAGIQSADAQIAAANSAVPAGSEVLEGVIQERDLGTRTTLDVLNSQAELINARKAGINASTQKVVATFSLLSATGQLAGQELCQSLGIEEVVDYTQTVEDVWQELRTVED